MQHADYAAHHMQRRDVKNLTLHLTMIITDTKVLRTTSQYLSVEQARECGIFHVMEEALNESKIEGCGIAAIQIGKPLACFIMKSGENIYRMVNPMIYDRQDPVVNANEGCLSLPGVKVNTQRFNEIKVSFDDYDTGKHMNAVMQGLEAIIYQHEYDHCAGILITDREYHAIKAGRNDPCPCGSGKKYKKCCLK